MEKNGTDLQIFKLIVLQELGFQAYKFIALHLTIFWPRLLTATGHNSAEKMESLEKKHVENGSQLNYQYFASHLSSAVFFLIHLWVVLISLGAPLVQHSSLQYLSNAIYYFGTSFYRCKYFLFYSI